MTAEETYTSLFKDFTGRDEDLRKIKRYSYYKMLYRSNVLTHSHRVAAITKYINKQAVKAFGAANYDPKKAEIMAYIHDDPEIIFGDVLAGDKSKMDSTELAKVKQTEKQAIEDIAKRFPKHIAGYIYHDLLIEAEKHLTIESQVVQYADKYDALGEAMHEMHAGNWHFITNVTNEYGLIPTPIEFYYDYFNKFPKTYPNLKPLLESNLPIFSPFLEPAKYIDITKNGKPHSVNGVSRVKTKTGDTHYDQWLKIVLNCGNQEVIKDLYIQKEK